MCSTSVSCSNSELDSLHFIVCYNSNNFHVTVIHLFGTMESYYALLSVFLLSLTAALATYVGYAVTPTKIDCRRLNLLVLKTNV